MSNLAIYATPEALPTSQAGRVGLLLGLEESETLTDVGLASRVSRGLRPAAVTNLAGAIGKAMVIGPIVPEATLRRARKTRRSLSREMSERLYEVGRVLDAVGRMYRGDESAARRFLTTPHPLLENETPLDLARSSSAGADAVLNLMHRTEAGFPV